LSIGRILLCYRGQRVDVGQRFANLLWRVEAGHVMAVVLHHVPGAVVPRPEVGPELTDLDAELGGEPIRYVDELPGPSLNVIHRQFGADRHHLGVDARVHLAQLGPELRLQLLRPVRRHDLVGRAE
jgi:hypothetical protein